MMRNNRVSEQNRRVAVTILAAIALILLYILIFQFSEQDGETSGSISYQVSKTCVELVDEVSARHWDEELKSRLAAYFEHPLRKLAHFSEYACMAVLLYLLWSQWLKKKRYIFGIILIWVFLSAGFDEYHQLSSPGRSGNFGDVLLDTCGGIFGFFVCMLAGKIRRFFKY